jgi:hypothetical protein
MSNTDNDNSEMSADDVEQLVTQALGEVLNWAGQVAELQNTDDAAEEIYAVCDLVAAYYGLERDIAVTEEHEDGSFTTRFERAVPELDTLPVATQTKSSTAIPGHVTMRNSSKRRIIDRNSTPDLPDMED